MSYHWCSSCCSNNCCGKCFNLCEPTCNFCEPLFSPCSSICNPWITFCPTNPCPNVAFITSSTNQFSVNSGTPNPFQIGSTSLPSNIHPINSPSFALNPEVNVGGISYDTTSGRFTIPLSGNYLLSASFSIVNTATTSGNLYVYIVRIKANSGIVDQLAADIRPIDATARVTLTTVAYLNVGDRILFAVAQNTGNALNIFPTSDPSNRFAIVRIC
ncbi:MAG: hypothetical protein QW303_05345 [Nitrososphaerota archaeon]